ncbi:MAG: STAS domain-containing protein [Pseudonocardia sp.]
MTDQRDGAPLLTLSDARHGSAVVLSACGEIDVATGPQLRAALSEALGEGGVDTVVVDLCGITFMGSTAIAVLVDAHWEAGQSGRSMRLVTGETRAVMRPLEAAGVASLFTEYADVGAALRS